MKNVVVGIFSALTMIYVIAIILTLYNVNSRKNQIEKVTSDVMYEHMKNNLSIVTQVEEANEENSNELKKDLKEEKTTKLGKIIQNPGENKLKKELENRMIFIKDKDELKISILKYDLNKGIICVEVHDKYRIFSGKIKNIKVYKQIIFDKEDISLKEKTEYRTLIFYDRDIVYKKVRLKVGSVYKVPEYIPVPNPNIQKKQVKKEMILIKPGEKISVTNEMPNEVEYSLIEK
ncbi:hypothetical protein [Lachnobacterium bovis]|uniref:Uncharacterized protein n=1 Tax=Lachnobacterium bovis DSM 14045 TaxID=1122142 RepID=A0A1H3JIH8_9FIRM|nr:hypothetical protein [Lachnobacterium bovis]SDY39773.1 hypothetical protein SAMN02910414_01480 [Lachnobacterium bovis DSM 14045]